MEFDLNSRKRIFETIQRSPGIHLPEMERSLDMAAGNLQYNLHHMEKKNIVFSVKDEQFVRYFVKDKKLAASVRKILSFLRKKPADIFC